MWGGIMKEALRVGALAGVLAVLALFAGTVGAAGAPERSTGQATDATPATPAIVDVNFVINRFVRQGRRIVAQGNVIATATQETMAPAVVRKAFVAAVKTKRGTFSSAQSAQRICDVLTLNLGPLHLEILGLVVDLSRVVLTIKADSNGGLLGSLFCGLAGPASTASLAKLNRTAKRMTKAAKTHGLNQGVAGFQVQAPPGFTQAPGTTCTILDLVLGPLDLNLLGLLIHLDRLRLTITAVRGGGLLGDLLCGLLGPPPPGVVHTTRGVAVPSG
jgi:hypothetical protein